MVQLRPTGSLSFTHRHRTMLVLMYFLILLMMDKEVLIPGQSPLPLHRSMTRQTQVMIVPLLLRIPAPIKSMSSSTMSISMEIPLLSPQSINRLMGPRRFQRLLFTIPLIRITMERIPLNIPLVTVMEDRIPRSFR